MAAPVIIKIMLNRSNNRYDRINLNKNVKEGVLITNNIHIINNTKNSDEENLVKIITKKIENLINKDSGIYDLSKKFTQ